ncbi:rod shape-determining protein MreD [Nonomuraea sp. NPDC050536]|uniref:rod shape-determining protein MreD n=1 Tax=Nonomuraea sp. NPDC050536 TaxID=3364366 RepID=UPI0037CA2AEC
MALVVLAVLPLVQVMLVNGLPWGGPDLVLLGVLWVALSRGALWGCAGGFVAGLAVDLVPPADHTVGRDALVLAVVGLLAGRSGRFAALVPVVGACAGLVLQAGAALLLGEASWAEVGVWLPWVSAWTVAGAALMSAALRLRRHTPAWRDPAWRDPAWHARGTAWREYRRAVGARRA